MPIESKVIHSDCLRALRDLPDESVNLIYLDPPFFTQKKHKLSNRERTKVFAFNDVWQSHQDYATFLHDRLRELRRILCGNGSLFFHCDRNANHVIRMLLDHVFGENCFRSEIIWRYRRWSNSKQGLMPAHQNIYYYSKSADFVFNPIYEDYSPSTNVDQILQRRVRGKHGKTMYERDKQGEFVSNGGKKGVPLSDVWDIPYLNPKAKERTGYPTQKPIILLERIINLASNPGDLVLDPFCGSGTTLVAAHLLSRNAIGIDNSQDAVELTKKRCANPCRTDSKLLKVGRDSYRQANLELLGLLNGIEFAPVQRNKGIDAILATPIDGKPVLVRVQRLHESIADALIKLKKAAYSKNSGALILITTRARTELPFGFTQPDNVCIIEAPVIRINQLLNKAAIKKLIFPSFYKHTDKQIAIICTDVSNDSVGGLPGKTGESPT